MSPTSILNPLSRAAARIALSLALLSPAHAADQQYAAAVYPDVSRSAQRAPTVLTSRLPWVAPVGHRQPRLADVPRDESVAAWESQQRQANEELDRKLIICKGC
ncbi:hypothetical protein QA641_00185 [Bradyrhizobium sp. CB1650]|uniref:hypothetical protein n=1 Tax=Bradyrhizobium sp. CB1650 TaxID=3039153 RepID=UPI0024348BA4|nr:hypothetical protein [Bradyrhizobium sp. CB1650]WGD52411.1 hypothetical protein QA641_00185 [Bradyrhizobium sp. CB1650]